MSAEPAVTAPAAGRPRGTAAGETGQFLAEELPEVLTDAGLGMVIACVSGMPRGG